MGKIIGLDTSVFIYVLEEHPSYFSVSRQLLNSIEKGKKRGVFSAIGLIEILTGPKKAQKNELAQQYKQLITTFPHLSLIGLNEKIVDLASDLRAKYSLRTPDAIHLATAIDGGAKTFLTNDKALRGVKEIKIQLLSSL